MKNSMNRLWPSRPEDATLLAFFCANIAQLLLSCSQTATVSQHTEFVCSVCGRKPETRMQTADRPTSLKLNPETYQCLVKSEQINRVKFGSSQNSHNKIIFADNQLLRWTPPQFSEKRNQISPDPLKPQPEYINISVISAPWCRYQTHLTALTDLMTLYINFFSYAPTSDNLTHDIKIIRVRFGFAPAPYWSSVSVVYKHDTEKTQEWFSSDDMSSLKDLGLPLCVAQCHSVPPDLAKRLFTIVKKLSVLVFWGF